MNAASGRCAKSDAVSVQDIEEVTARDKIVDVDRHKLAERPRTTASQKLQRSEVDAQSTA